MIHIIISIIQNITLISHSLNPVNSKWWWNGAILNILFPFVNLKYVTCITTDNTYIQMKMLNTAKGPGVQCLRAQIDKLKYPKYGLFGK